MVNLWNEWSVAEKKRVRENKIAGRFCQNNY